MSFLRCKCFIIMSRFLFLAECKKQSYGSKRAPCSFFLQKSRFFLDLSPSSDMGAKVLFFINCYSKISRTLHNSNIIHASNISILRLTSLHLGRLPRIIGLSCIFCITTFLLITGFLTDDYRLFWKLIFRNLFRKEITNT